MRRVPSAGRLFAAAVVVALVPIAVAVVRAARSGWLPLADNGYFLIRSRDVLTEHHPLLGTWTSASLNTDTHFNNPGPLLFDLLAIPTKLGGGIGLGVGVAILNGSALVGVGLMARRRGGPMVGALAVLVASLLAWTMGSELLYDAWQPHSLLLPFLFTLLCAWSVADGDLGALPWGAAAGSLVVQTHLSYAVLISAATAWALLGLGSTLRRRRIEDPEAWASVRRAAARTGAVTVGVLALCWVQPLVEAFTADGQGNLERLARNGASADATVGTRLGTRIVADTLTVPPFWFRPSFEEALLHDFGVEELPSVTPSFPVAALLLAGLAALMAAAASDAWRRRDRTTWTGLVTAGLVLLAGLATSIRLPLGTLYVVPHQFRWLWPAAAFTTLTLATAGLRRIAPSGRRVHGATIALCALTAVVAGATVPTHNVNSGPVASAAAVPTLRAAMAQMDVLEGRGTILVDVTGIRFAEPYSAMVMAELQARGIPFTIDDEVMVRQLGESRRERGRAQERILFREGDAAHAGIDGTRRVVYVEGLTPAERRERDDLRDRIAGHLLGGVTTRDLDGRGLAPAYIAAVPRAARPTRAEVDAFFDSGALVRLVEGDLIVAPPAWGDRLERFAELDRRWQRHTFAVFLAPITGSDP